MNPNDTSKQITEYQDEPIAKSEVEDVVPAIRNLYEIFIKYVGEDAFKKLFSKNLVYKEEGLETFEKEIPKMFKDSNPKQILDLSLKMVNSLVMEKFPQVVTKAIEIFEGLINESKKNKITEFKIADNFLKILKEKLGDSGVKLRQKTVDAYITIINSNFLDYNKTVTDLADEDAKLDIKRAPKNSKVILSKLTIFDRLLDDLDTSINSNLTAKDSFPVIQLSGFTLENINHNKNDIRKLDRTVISKIAKNFGFDKLEPLLQKIDVRDLEKLVPLIKEVQEIVNKKNPKQTAPLNRSMDRGRKGNKTDRSMSKENTIENKAKNKSLSLPKQLTCNYCGKSKKSLQTEEDLELHKQKECVMFNNCLKCKDVLEIKNYNAHLLNDCECKEDFKLCKRCKEPIDAKEFDQHVKDNKCNPAKNINSSNRCPLCHKDIAPGDKGFVQHLVKDICQKNKRRDKVATVNGK